MLFLLLIIFGAIAIAMWLPLDMFIVYCALVIAAIGFLPPFVKGKRKDGIEGTVELVWNAIPSFRQRALFSLYLAALLAFSILAAWQRWFSSSPLLRSLMLIGFAGSGVVMPTLRPQRYYMTDRGLWCTRTSPLGNPESQRYTPQRCALWEDVTAFVVRQDKIVLYLRPPQWLRWLPKGAGQVQIPLAGFTSDRLPGITSELENDIVAHIRSHCPETQ